jgi:hypothetical protein
MQASGDLAREDTKKHGKTKSSDVRNQIRDVADLIVARIGPVGVGQTQTVGIQDGHAQPGGIVL